MLVRAALLGLTCALRLAPVPPALADPSAAPVPPSPRAAPAEDLPLPPPPERNVPPAVVRAVEPGDLPDDPTSFTSVIETRDLEGEGKSVEDVLADTVGVQVRRFGGPGQPAELSIRGSTASQVVILLDGVRLNDARAGAVDLSTIPLDLLERIEVSRGGGSVQEGSGAIGGVVNLVTKRPGAEPETRLAVEGGSFDTWAGSALHARRAGAWEITTGYDGFGTDGDFEFQRPVFRVGGSTFRFDPDHATRINDESERHASLLRIGRDLGDRVHASMSSTASFLSRGVPGLDSGSGATAGQRERAHERRFRHLGDARVEAAGVAGLDAALGVYHRYDRTRFQDPIASGLCGRIDEENATYALGTRASLEREIETGPLAHRLSLTGDLREDRLTATEMANRTRLAAGGVLQDEIALFERRLRIAPALRLDDTEGFGGEWLPRAGIVLEPVPWLRLRGNAERAYRAPDFGELYLPDQCFLRGNPNLQPEDAASFDAGGELLFARVGPFENLRVGGAWFRQNVDDSIVFVLVSPFTIAPRNTGAATIEGGELEAEIGLLGWARLSGNLTLLDATLDGSGARLPGRAESEASVRLELGPPSRMARVVGEMHRTGSIAATDSGGTEIPARTTWDLLLLLDLRQLPGLRDVVPGERFLVSFLVRNLTDRSVRDALFLPQPGRSFALRAEAVF